MPAHALTIEAVIDLDTEEQVERLSTVVNQFLSILDARRDPKPVCNVEPLPEADDAEPDSALAVPKSSLILPPGVTR